MMATAAVKSISFSSKTDVDVIMAAAALKTNSRKIVVDAMVRTAAGTMKEAKLVIVGTAVCLLQVSGALPMVVVAVARNSKDDAVAVVGRCSKGISVSMPMPVSVVAARSVSKALLAALGVMIIASISSSSRTGSNFSGDIASRTWTRGYSCR